MSSAQGSLFESEVRILLDRLSSRVIAGDFDVRKGVDRHELATAVEMFSGEVVSKPRQSFESACEGGPPFLQDAVEYVRIHHGRGRTDELEARDAVAIVSVLLGLHDSTVNARARA